MVINITVCIEAYNNFKYLGSIINRKHMREEEIDKRVAMGKRATEHCIDFYGKALSVKIPRSA